MAWTLTDTENGQSVPFAVSSGDVSVEVASPTAVLYPLRSNIPVVLSGMPRYGKMSTPEWIVTGNGAWAAMETILRSGHLLGVVTDYGDTYLCRVAGTYTARVEDTPDRATNPRRFVTVDLVGAG